MNGVLLVNKPKMMSSGDVVYKLRKVLQTKKIGHSGTLDPLATGLLVLCIGRATRISEYLTSDTKEYIATITIGYSTTTEDRLGELIDEKKVSSIENIDDVLQSFLGEYTQTPPIYSAIKVNGKRLYEYARKGEKVDIPSRNVFVYNIERVSEIEYNEGRASFSFKVTGSKGIYIRTLCVDIGLQLGYPAHMSELLRTKSGSFSIEESYSLEQIEAGEYELLSITNALQQYPQLEIEDDRILKKIENGAGFYFDFPDSDTVVLTHNDATLGLYEVKDNTFKAKKIFKD